MSFTTLYGQHPGRSVAQPSPGRSLWRCEAPAADQTGLVPEAGPLRPLALAGLRDRWSAAWAHVSRLAA